MIYRLFILFAILFFSGCYAIEIENNNRLQRQFDFDENVLGENSATDVALGVLAFLQKNDTATYEKMMMPLEVEAYLFEENFNYRPDISDLDSFVQVLDSTFAERKENFYVRANYFHQTSSTGNAFRLKDAVFKGFITDTVDMKNHFAINGPIYGEWVMVAIKLEYNDHMFYVEIPQIIQLKNKWFLYYPEYYLRSDGGIESMLRFYEKAGKSMDNFPFKYLLKENE